MRRFDLVIVSMVTAILLLGLMLISWHTVRSAEDVLLPALNSKAQSVASAIAGLGSEAVGYGIPVDRFVEADAVLRAVLDENGDFAFATIFNADGDIIAQATRGNAGGYDGAHEDDYIMVSAPILAAGAVAGETTGEPGGEAAGGAANDAAGGTANLAAGGAPGAAVDEATGEVSGEAAGAAPGPMAGEADGEAAAGDLGAVAGEVLIGTPRAVGERLVRDLWIDVAVLLLVSVLVTLELTAFAFTLPSALVLRGLTQRLEAVRRGDLRPHPELLGRGPLAEEVTAADEEIARMREEHRTLRERANAAGDTETLEELARLDARHRLSERRELPPVNLAAVRAPIFLFFFAEEMTRPFLPSYIATYAQPMLGLSVELVIALPIILFMAIVALTQPTLNGWTERLGRARSLRTGALLACFGYFGTGFASSMPELIAARTLTAMGFAIVFVSAQGFIVDRTSTAHRARGIGLFVSAIMAAMLCGPPIGGIVADRLGDATAFTVSAVMALVAYVCALVALPSDGPRGGIVPRAVRLSDVRRVLSEPLMVSLVVGCALPAKMLLIGLCFYILPLSLAGEFEPDVIGRVLMLYGLAMLVIVPAVSRWSDQASLRMSFVVMGGIASALAVAHFFIWPQPWGAALMVLQIGIAQGISTTPQSALVGEIGKRILPDLSEGGIYGVFRLVERMGTAIGPLFVGLVWSFASLELAMVATALLVACGALTFALVWWGTSTEQKNAARGAEG